MWSPLRTRRETIVDICPLLDVSVIGVSPLGPATVVFINNIVKT